MQTNSRHVDFTDNYSADYFTYLDEFGALMLRMKLTIQHYDISTWTASADGVDGLWLGVGFGQYGMTGSDLVLCTFRYYEPDADDQFMCTDRYAHANGRPEIDTDQNVVFVTQIKVYNTNALTATLSVTFDRPLDADQTTHEDVDLQNGKTYPGIWAIKPINPIPLDSLISLILII